MSTTIIEKLVERGFQLDELEKLDADRLTELYNQEASTEQQLEDIEDDFDLEIDDEPEVPVLSEEVPLITSPEWGQYVLDQFVDDELWNGHPTVDGLRRVTELLLGEIIDIEPAVLQTPDPSNEHRATVMVRITIMSNDSHSSVKTFSGCADAYEGNLEKHFKLHPVAMAETRATGRALRSALRLKAVSAEEVSAAPKDEVANSAEKQEAGITEGQFTALNMMAQRLDLNMEKVAKHFADKGLLVYNTIGSLTSSDGALLVQEVSALQKKPDAILAELKGYDANWRTK